jgi:hypothetical protein
VGQLDREIAGRLKDDQDHRAVRAIPGVGAVLGAVFVTLVYYGLRDGGIRCLAEAGLSMSRDAARRARRPSGIDAVRPSGIDAVAKAQQLAKWSSSGYMTWELG